ncbi:hypothetical protein HKCCE2091_02760 [Rhodobacterales bacterium HKCCE2091]|nr:hypothetical protein [Rhodobacterales bacterium HKCCE2091]
MRLALFILVNLAVAAGFGLLAYLDGHGAGAIILRIAIVLVAVQACYVAWMVVSAWLSPDDPDAATSRNDAKAEPLTATRKAAQRSAR